MNKIIKLYNMKRTIRFLTALLLLLLGSSSVGALAQSECKLNDVTWATLSDAFTAIYPGTTVEIDILEDVTPASAPYPSLSSNNTNITINLHGHNVILGGISDIANLTINGDGGSIIFKNAYGINNANGGNNQTLAVNKSDVVLENGMQWMALNISLVNNAHVTIYNNLYLGYNDPPKNLDYDIDGTSWMKLISCNLSGYNYSHVHDALLNLVRPDLKSTFTVPGTYGTAAEPYTFRGVWGITLDDTFGSNATVKFYDGGLVNYDGEGNPTNLPTAASITSTNYPDDGGIKMIVNNDGKDRYIIMHVVPAAGNWTDESLLWAYEAGAALSRTRGIDIDPIRRPTLLKKDTYTYMDINAKEQTADRNDGAGWYYYVLPGTHNVSAKYTSSLVDGFAPKLFGFSTDDEDVRIAQDFDNKTITLSRTTDNWTAELTYDKFKWAFNGSFGTMPKVVKIVVKNSGTDVITITDEKVIASMIDHNYGAGMLYLGNLPLKPGAIGYGLFTRRDDNDKTYFIVDLPFEPLDPNDAVNHPGSEKNPWLIRNANELNLLAKCVNVAGWSAQFDYLRQTADIDMSSVNDFEPIGFLKNFGQFCGNYDGYGKTISNINFKCSLEDSGGDGLIAYVGLFGRIHGFSDGGGSVKNVTLMDCSFKATATSCATAVGGIAGMATGMADNSMNITDCKVLGNSVIEGLPANCFSGAIVGNYSPTTNKLENNYYGFGVTVTNPSTSLTGYSKRGTCFGTYDMGTASWSYAWNDVTTDDGAMLYVKKATVPPINANGSKVEFNEVEKGTNRYDFGGDDDFYYAVGQPVTLKVTTGTSTDGDIRTFYDELSTLTMNDGTSDTDIKTALGFTMPAADATVSATFASSDWFTINTVNYNATDPSQPFDYNWMTFYHEWTDGTGTAAKPANYKVTNYDNPLLDVEVMTVSRVNSADGKFALAEIYGGICYNGVPTIFHYAEANDATAVLPQKLKFTPVDPNDPQAPAGGYTVPTVAPQFQGTVSDKTLTADDKCYILNNAGDFILAYPTDGDDKIAAHKCYIDWTIEDNGNTQAPARLVLSGDDTGIERILFDGSSDGDWYSLDGRRLNGQPTRKGLYIFKGKKTVIR